MRCYIFTLDDDGRTLNAREIDCNNADEALQLGSASAAEDHVEFWCGCVAHAVSPASSLSGGRSGRFGGWPSV
jgi:hypothetical protein